MNFAIKLSTLLFISTCSFFFQGVDTSKRVGHFNLDSKHLAIDGYDPVAYFTKGVATEGSKKYSLNYKGVTYYFNGEKVSINPKTFKIVDGKLYLFYNKLFTNTLIPWNEDEDNLKGNADDFWKELIR